MIKLSALHGFLGAQHDWDFLDGSLENATLEKEDLFSNNSQSTGNTFSEFGKAFNLKKSSIKDGKLPVLMGYSLEGRLAMHALLESRNYWKGAIIISSHTGLTDESAKNARLKSDRDFNELLQNGSWNEFISKWNSQEVFRNTATMHREESYYNKKLLSRGFLEWSLGNQNDLKASLESLDLPIFWIAGKEDKKYADIASGLRLKHPSSLVWIAEESGHRVPWQIKTEFSKRINEFLEIIL